ncbi:MAG: hypothetical protein AB1665_05660 [Candidatus Thermoplasmatota archaeon]
MHPHWRLQRTLSSAGLLLILLVAAGTFALLTLGIPVGWLFLDHLLMNGCCCVLAFLLVVLFFYSMTRMEGENVMNLPSRYVWCRGSQIPPKDAGQAIECALKERSISHSTRLGIEQVFSFPPYSYAFAVWFPETSVIVKVAPRPTGGSDIHVGPETQGTSFLINGTKEIIDEALSPY